MLPFPHALPHSGRDHRSRSAHRRGAFPYVRDRQTRRRKDERRINFPKQRRQPCSDRDRYSAACSPNSSRPYLPNFPFSPTEAKFVGAPIDFLVFKGMDDQHIEEVIFVEVKSGSARLNHNEHSLKDAIENKRVRWHEYHVPAPSRTPPTPQPNPRSKPKAAKRSRSQGKTRRSSAITQNTSETIRSPRRRFGYDDVLGDDMSSCVATIALICLLSCGDSKLVKGLLEIFEKGVPLLRLDRSGGESFIERPVYFCGPPAAQQTISVTRYLKPAGGTR